MMIALLFFAAPALATRRASFVHEGKRVDRLLLPSGIEAFTDKAGWMAAAEVAANTQEGWCVEFDLFEDSSRCFQDGVGQRFADTDGIDRIRLIDFGDINYQNEFDDGNPGCQQVNLISNQNANAFAVMAVDGKGGDTGGVEMYFRGTNFGQRGLVAWSAYFTEVGTETFGAETLIQLVFGAEPSRATVVDVALPTGEEDAEARFIGFVSLVGPMTRVDFYAKDGEADRFSMDNVCGFEQDEPSASPSEQPSAAPSESPSSAPSASPSEQPSAAPSESPSNQPSAFPSESPSTQPSAVPSESPSSAPSKSSAPSSAPSKFPSSSPSESSAPSSSPLSSPGDPECFWDGIPVLGLLANVVCFILDVFEKILSIFK